ncbi:porin family protein [Lysobacter tyrosinilyticus]
MKKTLILSVALALAGLSTSALAAEGQGFVRGTIGQTNVDVDGGGSDDDTSFSVGGGYYFNANFAVEGAYSDLYNKDGGKLSSFGAGVVGKKNFGANNSGFFIDGRLGVERVKGEASDGVTSVDDTSTKAYYGVGAGYDFSEAFGLSLNYTFHKADLEGLSLDADTISVAGEYRF